MIVVATKNLCVQPKVFFRRFLHNASFIQSTKVYIVNTRRILDAIAYYIRRCLICVGDVVDSKYYTDFKNANQFDLVKFYLSLLGDRF